MLITWALGWWWLVKPRVFLVGHIAHLASFKPFWDSVIDKYMKAQKQHSRLSSGLHKHIHTHACAHVCTCTHTLKNSKNKWHERSIRCAHALPQCKEESEAYGLQLCCLPVQNSSGNFFNFRHLPQRQWSAACRPYAVRLSLGCSSGPNFWNPLILITEKCSLRETQLSPCWPLLIKYFWTGLGDRKVSQAWMRYV